MDEHPGAPMELHISAEVKQRLDARRILHDDVRMVIEHAERTASDLVLMPVATEGEGVLGRLQENEQAALLMCAAATVLSQVRESDVTGRYGGEEFAILATGETAEGAAALAERCRQAVEKSEVVIEGKTVQITASFGVADSNGADSPQAIIDLADQALYEAKAAGRNRVHVAVAGQAAVHAPTPPRTPPTAVSGSHS